MYDIKALRCKLSDCFASSASSCLHEMSKDSKYKSDFSKCVASICRPEAPELADKSLKISIMDACHRNVRLLCNQREIHISI
jgi:hypothetical protein